MTQLNDTDTAQMPRYETPTFSPRGAFATTLRSGELARLGRLSQHSSLPAPRKLASIKPVVASRRYETPTFHPRGAFARTLRGGEIALLERESRMRQSERPQLVVAAAA